jgi:hypothetical protein
MKPKSYRNVSDYLLQRFSVKVNRCNKLTILI